MFESRTLRSVLVIAPPIKICRQGLVLAGLVLNKDCVRTIRQLKVAPSKFIFTLYKKETGYQVPNNDYLISLLVSP